jgi:FlaG/FlaF family flagellin (archaellin)
MRSTRTTIAVVAAIAALGALAAVAFASGGEPTPSAPAPAAETDPPAQVQTKVIRRTVHVRQRDAARSSSDDDGTLDQGRGDRPQIPVSPAAPATTGHDVGDDHGRDDFDDDDRFDDHGGDDHDNSGPGSDHSGHGHGGDDD